MTQELWPCLYVTSIFCKINEMGLTSIGAQKHQSTGEKSRCVNPICRNQITAVTDRKGEKTDNLTVYETAKPATIQESNLKPRKPKTLKT